MYSSQCPRMTETIFSLQPQQLHSPLLIQYTSLNSSLSRFIAVLWLLLHVPLWQTYVFPFEYFTALRTLHCITRWSAEAFFLVFTLNCEFFSVTLGDMRVSSVLKPVLHFEHYIIGLPAEDFLWTTMNILVCLLSGPFVLRDHFTLFLLIRWRLFLSRTSCFTVNTSPSKCLSWTHSWPWKYHHVS